MAKFKVLKGVANNIADSFTSLMNFAQDDYSLGHILRFARESGMSTLTIDLLAGQGSPTQLLRDPISGLPKRYSDMFLRIVQSSGSARELIQSATLTLTYDLQKTRSNSPFIAKPQNPYVCEVSILDTRGKTYTAHLSGWWFVERGEEIYQSYDLGKLPARQWWNPFRWLRSLFRSQ